MRRIPLALLLIPAAALVVVLPLMVRGCSCGHDFDFHLVSWLEAAAQFRAGNLHPSWAFSPGWNAGEPRFVFYPPLSWTLGALLGMMLPWVAVPIVYTWLALLVAGLAIYHFARELGGETAVAGPVVSAQIAAVAYVANPYMVFTAYERTAYAELLAAAWIPFLLAAILRGRVTVLRVAVPVALLWLTNAPAAVMGCYSLALLAAVRVFWIWQARRKDTPGTARECWTLVWRVIAGVVLGLGLAAFYIVPAAYERRWVQIAMAMISGMRIEDNFLFHHTGDGPHDDVLHTASVIAVALLAVTAIAFALSSLRWRSATESGPESALRRYRIVSLAMLAGAIGSLLTPLSATVWRVMPEMAFLQFPWRFTAVLAAVACGGIAMAVGGLKLKGPVLAAGALAIAAALSLPAASAFRQECDDPDTVAARVAVFAARTGTDPTDEYTPANADNDSLGHANPPFWLAKDGQAQPSAAGLSPGPAPMHFAIDPAEPTAIVLNLRDYPAWVERLNGVAVTEKIQRDDGLIAFPVPAGHSQIDVAYKTTWDHELGDGISLASLCALFGWIGIKRRRAAKGRT